MHASVSYCAVYCNILFRNLICSIHVRHHVAPPTSANHVHAIHAQPSPSPARRANWYIVEHVFH